MKKLSIISLIISIIALAIAVWVWTGGFGGAGTALFNVTPINNGGPGKGGNTGGGAGSFRTNIGVTADSDLVTSGLVSDGDAIGNDAVFIIRAKMNNATGNLTVMPTWRKQNIDAAVVNVTLKATDDGAITLLQAAAQNAVKNMATVKAQAGTLNISDNAALWIAMESEINKTIDVAAFKQSVASTVASWKATGTSIVSGTTRAIINWPVPINARDAVKLVASDRSYADFAAEVLMQMAFADSAK